ncbi:MAG: hypothetical protein VXW32_08000 [Myxococcota bacterium]|jgi:hypothetical protein|nr:hypothetical protein [Myxococcota bacterium]
MKANALILFAAGLMTACGPKLHDFVMDIEHINVRAEREPLPPVVELGSVEVDRNEDGKVTGVEHAAAATNQGVDVFETAFAQRLDSQVRQQALITDVAQTIRQTIEKKGGPFPLNPRSGWRMITTISHWGVTTGFSGAADSYITIRTDLWSPDGEHAWSDYQKCYRDLAPERGSDRGQIASNVAALGAIGDGQIKRIFNELAIECGRRISREFQEDVARAMARAQGQ